MARVFVGLLPVFIFLVALYYLDSYKLIKLRHVLVTIVVGCTVALASLFLNSAIISLWGIEFSYHSGYVAPVVEEVLKASFIIYLIKSSKVGFMVDAALYGLAIGAGFAFTENIYYLYNLHDSNLLFWLIRGFGTAMMHCGTTALFAITAKIFFDLDNSNNVKVFLPGLLLAIIFHSVYNHFILNPVISTLLIIIVLPSLMLVVFKRSEESTRKWLGMGLDTDVEVLDSVTTGEFSTSNIGIFLNSLRSHFPPEIIGDMLCFIRIQTELGIRAKGIMIMRELGFEIPHDPEITEKLAELKYLHRNIGKIGLLAISPLLHRSRQSSWQMNMLTKDR